MFGGFQINIGGKLPLITPAQIPSITCGSSGPNAKTDSLQLWIKEKVAILGKKDEKTGGCTFALGKWAKPQWPAVTGCGASTTYVMDDQQMAALVPLFRWHCLDFDSGRQFDAYLLQPDVYRAPWEMAPEKAPVGAVYNKAVRDSVPVLRFRYNDVRHGYFYRPLTPTEFDQLTCEAIWKREFGIAFTHSANSKDDKNHPTRVKGSHLILHEKRMAADTNRNYPDVPTADLNLMTYIETQAKQIKMNDMVNEGVCFYQPVRGNFSWLSVCSNNQNRGRIFAFC